MEPLTKFDVVPVRLGRDVFGMARKGRPLAALIHTSVSGLEDEAWVTVRSHPIECRCGAGAAETAIKVPLSRR